METDEQLLQAFPELIRDISSKDEKIFILSDSSKLLDVVKIIKQRFDALFMLMVVDRPPEKFEMNYVFFRYSDTHVLIVRTDIDRKEASIDSISKIFKSAEWEEREAYDMFNITFKGHQDLRRLLLPEDWPGRPLRKDFVVTKETSYWTGLDMKF